MTIYQSNLLNSFYSYVSRVIDHSLKSVTSPKFYADVLQNFKGYGIGFLFFHVYWASFIVILVLIFQLNTISNFVSGAPASNRITFELDNILSQWDTLYFKNGIMESDIEEPKYIKDLSGKNIILVDLSDNMSVNENSELIAVIAKEKIILNPNFLKDDNMIVRKYTDFIFSDFTKEISKDEIKKIIASFIKSNMRVVIYVMFPIMAIVGLMKSLFAEIFLILMMWFTIKIVFSSNFKFNDIFRVVIYSSALPSFFFVLSLVLYHLYYVFAVMQFYTLFLVASGIVPVFKK